MSDACRSCHAAIEWVETPAGKRMPVDARRIAGVLDDGSVAQVRLSHFATCPQAAQHRKPARRDGLVVIEPDPNDAAWCTVRQSGSLPGPLFERLREVCASFGDHIHYERDKKQRSVFADQADPLARALRAAGVPVDLRR